MSEEETLHLTPAERGKLSILVVESDANDRNNMRATLRNLGVQTMSEAPTHMSALEKLDERRFTHIIFEAKKTNMPTKEFLAKVFEGYPDIIAIPASLEPNVDDVFDMLIMGAKGYLVKPYTVNSVDLAIVHATKGEPLSDAVLQAKDRNEALVAIILGSLDKAATLLRQAQQFETAKREVPKAISGLRRASELAKTFAKNGDEGLIEALEKFCIERSKGPASRLGRLRKRLKSGRVEDEVDNASDEAAA